MSDTSVGHDIGGGGGGGGEEDLVKIVDKTTEKLKVVKAVDFLQRVLCFVENNFILIYNEGRILYLMTLSTYYNYGYMMSDIW